MSRHVTMAKLWLCAVLVCIVPRAVNAAGDISVASRSAFSYLSTLAALPVPASLHDQSAELPRVVANPMFGPTLTACLSGILLGIIVLIMLYTMRHYLFTISRLFGRQRNPYLDIDTADWPSLTVLVAAHNEEAVIAGSLTCLLQVDYPAAKLTIMPVNDRSTDRTQAIVDDIALKNPGRITPFHRVDGKPGKAAALKEAMERITSEIIVIFDADYLPPRGLLKRLVAPFFDPEIGATMGRVIPFNVGKCLLTRLLDLERSGGYQVDQQARMNLGLVPQYGGTVGGIRINALKSVGGWHDDTLAEDTDLTYRLLLKGWKTVYLNRAECYEEVPESWPARVRQIKRWAKGHNQALYRHGAKLATTPGLNAHERVDGLALLGVYAMAPVLALAWLLAIVLFFANGVPNLGGVVGVLAMTSYGTLGNFAAFFEIAAAVRMDGNRKRIRLLPLTYCAFLVSTVAITRAVLDQIVFDVLSHRELHWDKTLRFRTAPVDLGFPTQNQAATDCRDPSNPTPQEKHEFTVDNKAA
jgi:cellulose synthase/poly-beta-1,6-N-acetylglucosamine synthase-like glycosyltransferase